jgi:plastocyanin
MTAKPKSGRGKMITVAAVVVVVVVIIAGYYVFSGMGSAPTGKTTITIASGTSTNNALNFNPASITVVVGKDNTIVFVNNDGTQHTVTFTSAPSGVSVSTIGTSNLAAGASYTVTLTTPGTYQYHCTIHPWMQGTIIVKSA